VSASRVCMFVHNPLLHDARVEREAATLAAAGYDVRVVAARGASTPARERRDGFEIERVDSDPAPTRVLRRALAARGRGADIGTVAAPLLGGRPGVRGAAERLALRAHLAAELARYVRRAAAAAGTAPAQVWMAHDLDTLPAAWLARRRFGGRLLYDSHELFSERIAVSSAARPFWRALERWLAPRADAVVTVGDGVAAELARRYRIASPAVVRNLPASAPDAAGDASPLRPALGLPAEARIALYLGGLQPGRGLERLVDVAARLDDGDVVVLMGPGHPEYVAGLRERAARAGAAEQVVLAPAVPTEDVVTWAAGADVGLALIQNVSLSYFLSLPNKLFEYVAAGLPVVASDFPELRGVVEGRGLGVVCAPDDTDAIAHAIAWTLDDPERHERLRAAARAAGAELTWDSESRILVELVDRLARG
jgi:glycosyltransferase involved in cell wall biosynthesis